MAKPLSIEKTEVENPDATAPTEKTLTQTEKNRTNSAPDGIGKCERKATPGRDSSKVLAKWGVSHLRNAREMLVVSRVLWCAWRMRDTLSMSARREITKKHAAEYGKASRKAKGVMLDQLVATTGWSRANARRALTSALQRKGPAKAAKRKPRSRTYGYGTLKLLIQVWNLAGRSSGKYLAATMLIWLPKLEQHHELDKARPERPHAGAVAGRVRGNDRPAAETDP
jgi:hypothetical protein